MTTDGNTPASIPAITDTPPRSWSAASIVSAKAAALRTRAVLEVRAISETGIVYIRDAADIRYSAELGIGEVMVGGVWVPLAEIGMRAWGDEEALPWEGPRLPQRVVIVGPDLGDEDGMQDTQPLEPITDAEAEQAQALADALAHPLAQEIAHEADSLRRDLAEARKAIEMYQAIIRQQSEMLMQEARAALAAAAAPVMQFVQVPVRDGQMPADKAALLADGWTIAHEQFVAVGSELHWCARLQRRASDAHMVPDAPAPTTDAISRIIVSAQPLAA